MSSSQLLLSASAIAKMKSMAADRELSQVLVQDDVCLGGLVVVLSNEDVAVVQIALETLLKLAEWPNLRTPLKDFLGMRSQLSNLIMSANYPAIQQLANKLFTLLYCALSPSSSPTNADCEICSPPPSRLMTSFVKKDTFGKRRRNSFFVRGVSKAKMITLQITGLADENDIDVCRSHLLTVPGVISITFDVKRQRAVLRTKNDLEPQTFVPIEKQLVKESSVDDSPSYPYYSESPVSGTQNVVRHGSDKRSGGSWGFLRTVGSIITNSLYW